MALERGNRRLCRWGLTQWVSPAECLLAECLRNSLSKDQAEQCLGSFPQPLTWTKSAA